MWYAPDKENKQATSMNEELLKLEGLLDDKEAKISLARFL